MYSVYSRRTQEELEIAEKELSSLPECLNDTLEAIHKRTLERKVLTLKRELKQTDICKRLYEEIFQQEIDDRNFRKKILTTDLLIKLDEKDKTTSKKGAFLFQFDKEKYDALLQEGLDIQFH